jgi:hypothetical protein
LMKQHPRIQKSGDMVVTTRPCDGACHQKWHLMPER